MMRLKLIALGAAAVLAAYTSEACAYIGPGAGFALLSSFLAVIVAFFTAFLALATFPIRKLVRLRRRLKRHAKARVDKVVILGLDGLDPEICETLMDSGDLPTFSELKASGTYRRLATSTPAMSPVAWSTFATGVDASRHGIFDFLARDPRTYLPVLSSSLITGGGRWLRLGPFRIPIRSGGVRLLRKSRSFWKVLSDYGVFCSVLRVPITFPPEKLNGVMLAGMCAPDLRGTMGSFTYYTSSDADKKTGGTVVKLRSSGGSRGERFDTALEGPKSPFAKGGSGGSDAGGDDTLKIPMTITVRKDRRGAEISVSGEKFFLREHEYSPWVRLTFKAATGVKLHGIAKFYITQLDGDFGLYVTPINIDPEKPAMPLSYPSFYSVYLSKLIGPYATLGLAEDTWAVEEGVLDEAAFLEQAYGFHEERRAMWFETLKKQRKGLVACVFDLSDRLQHLFFRYLVDDHSANVGKDTLQHRDALYDMYREMDRLVADTLRHIDDRTALIIISDHGFKPFRKGINLNTWLQDDGYLHFKEGVEPGEYLEGVDWTKTTAYAVGLGGIYINRKGRERSGIVESSDFDALKQAIKDGLLAIDDGGVQAVNRIFDVEKDFSGPYRNEGPDLIVGFKEGYRVSWDCAKGIVTKDIIEDNEKSWSGDHCMDPASVPGILFSNMNIIEESPGLVDIGPSVLDLFGVPVPRYMVGKSLMGQP
ncbi:MAG: nucleotide pyrophosphatase [Candidatus Latescibacteria bacterium]|nr:nucleotide pyrophosphatase [Candidatus Latescibacterota bacterium]NIM21541.1 nucleotide pyrophosphatase [Candidatus Latescibacterota bacterium]NIM65712.1 nucleotide pyrophosphatase [Candidatus Latescibacterota bacterium]NIO02094.1 nucleotide pyrophosphatase [Candidatus Latescibacterota bacterium]NIO28906.1 nucleotide pyrophosphatase [Candidatus Latescibacterota bacterium]